MGRVVSRLPAWAEDERLARAAWSRLAEPEDHVGLALTLRQMGRVAA